MSASGNGQCGMIGIGGQASKTAMAVKAEDGADLPLGVCMYVRREY
jgi:hypothetical protein